MILILITSAFGIWTTFQTLNELVQQRFLSFKHAKEVRSVVLALQIGLLIIVGDSRILLWLVTLGPALALKASVFVSKIIRTSKFKDEFCHYLDLVILEMRCGRGFRDSLSCANEKVDAFMQQKLAKITEAIRFSGDGTGFREDRFLFDIFEEFKSVDKNPHNSLQRLCAIRYRLRVESEYRRKSGQVVAQLRAQAGILVGLYLATLFFVLMQNSLSEILPMVLISLTLFTTGTLATFLYGRRYKWKV